MEIKILYCEVYLPLHVYQIYYKIVTLYFDSLAIRLQSKDLKHFIPILENPDYRVNLYFLPNLIHLIFSSFYAKQTFWIGFIELLTQFYSIWKHLLKYVETFMDNILIFWGILKADIHNFKNLLFLHYLNIFFMLCISTSEGLLAQAFAWSKTIENALKLSKTF